MIEYPNTKNQVIKGGRIIRFLRKWIILEAIILLVLCLFAAYSQLYHLRHYITNKDKTTIVADINSLLKLNYDGTPRDPSLPSHEVKNFSLAQDTFNFKNFGTYNSEGGNCAGFALFEKLNYMNKLKDIKFNVNGNIITAPDKIDLSTVNLSDEEVKKFYPDGGKSSKVNLVDPKKPVEDISGDLLYNINMNPIDDFTQDTSNKSLSKVLSMVNYLQQNCYSNIVSYKVFDTYFYTGKTDANIEVLADWFTRQYYSKLNPELITNKIDNNEPVVIALTPMRDGHAVLAYKYDYVDKNTMRIYVADSNFPLTGTDAKYDNQIKNNMYIILKKIGGTWQYIYNPKLNGSYVYRGVYNSYIPNTYLYIW